MSVRVSAAFVVSVRPHPWHDLRRRTTLSPEWCKSRGPLTVRCTAAYDLREDHAMQGGRPSNHAPSLMRHSWRPRIGVTEFACPGAWFEARHVMVGDFTSPVVRGEHPHHEEDHEEEGSSRRAREEP